jgi:hypothetical protein
MRIRRLTLLTAGAALAIGAGLTIPASAAFAGGTPGNCSDAAPVPTSGTAPNSGSASNTNGGACTVEGSATIAATMAMEVSTDSFSLPDGVSASVQSPANQFNIWIYSNTPSFYVSEAVTTPFTGTSDPGNTLLASDFSAGIDGAAVGCDSHMSEETQAPFTDDAAADGLSTPFTALSVPCPSSGWNYQNNNSELATGVSSGFPTPYDSFSLDGWSFVSSALTTGSNAPADTYTGDVTLALWS